MSSVQCCTQMFCVQLISYNIQCLSYTVSRTLSVLYSVSIVQFYIVLLYNSTLCSVRVSHNFVTFLFLKPAGTTNRLPEAFCIMSHVSEAHMYDTLLSAAEEKRKTSLPAVEGFFQASYATPVLPRKDSPATTLVCLSGMSGMLVCVSGMSGMLECLSVMSSMLVCLSGMSGILVCHSGMFGMLVCLSGGRRH